MKHLNLPAQINDVADAKALLIMLHENDLLFHCEDDATDCLEGLVSFEQATQLNKLMDDIYALPGNEDRAVLATFDPCGFSLELLNL